MGRLACVNVPALPLQLLLRHHPEWRAEPVVVVAEDKAQARILWVNAHAWDWRIRPGMRYAAALSLTGRLRGGVVAPAEVAAGVRDLTARLHRFSPHVEPGAEEPGVFWVDGTGLRRLFASAREWAGAITAALGAAGFHAAVVAGFNRFAAYAVAKSAPGGAVFASAAQERRVAERVTLERLEIEPELRDALHQLAIRTVRDLLGLPATGLLPRFGRPAHRLHQLAAGVCAEPWRPAAERLPIRERVVLDYPESDLERLLALVRGRLPPLLATLARRREALRALRLRLTLEDAPPMTARLAPATPTRDVRTLLELVRLRCEGWRLGGGVTEIELSALGAAREVEQLSLFAPRPRRDLAAADRALARLRAEFGEGAVVRAVARPGHLPEARFAWEPLARLARPDPPPEAPRALVRRLYARPRPLPQRRGAAGSDMNGGGGNGGGANGGAANGGGVPLLPPALAGEGGPLRALTGPYPISGGWWATPQHRDYYFGETTRGGVWWLYHDRRRDRWFLHGRVD